MVGVKKKMWKILSKGVMLGVLGMLVSSGMTADAANKLNFSEEELAYMPATKQIELFKKGDLAPIDVLNAQIARVQKYNGPYNTTRQEPEDYLTFNGKVNAICFDKFAEAKQQALEAEARYKNGTARPLEGITVGIKNENEVTGWVVDMGSLILKDMPPCEDDGAIINKLNEAGAIKVFSTTVPEFYISSMTWSRLYGVTRNPWNLYYGVGGSSGGSGAALAAGFCSIATGSDMGGSIRLPASMDGVYGFKPPFGRVATSNIQYETLGPLTRNFDDLVLMQNVICGPSEKVMSSLRPKLEYPAEYQSLAGTKIAVCYMDHWTEEGIDKDTVKAMDRTVEKLRSQGAQVDVIDTAEWAASKGLPTFLTGLLSTEMYVLVSAVDDTNRDQLCTYAAPMFNDPSRFNPEGLMKADALRSSLHVAVQKDIFGKGYLAIVMPTLATSHVPADLDATPDKTPTVNGKQIAGNVNIITPIWNLLDRYPVVDVPVGFTDKKVPIGVQVVGNTYSDLDAFRVAAALSKANEEAGEDLYTEGRIPDFRNEK